MSDSGKSPPGLRRFVPLLLVVVTCGLPVLAAWVFYLNPGLLPRERSNYGMLISPPRPMRDIRMRTAAGGDFRIEQAQGKWSLLWLISQPCDGGCDPYLQRLHNLRSALRDNGIRFQACVVPLGGSTAGARQKQAGYPGVFLLTGTDDQLRALADRFVAAAGPATTGAGGFYLLDPLGNLMMRYDAGADFKGILRDLDRLLKYSWVGR